MSTTALVGVTTGVMKPLLSKIAELLVQEHSRLKGVRKNIKFLEAELTAASSTLEMLADSELLDPETRIWRNTLRELAYDLEDCIDAFRARVDHEPKGRNRFKQLFDKMKKLKPRHEIAKQIEELKACAMDASERHNRYKSEKILSNCTSTYCAVDPRLSALYVEIDQLVGIDGPKKHVIEWLTMENKASSSEPKVLSIVGCGGLGKTTLANQVYQSVKSQFCCAAFVSVSRNPDVKKILRGIAKQVGIHSCLLDHDEKQLIDELRKHLQDKSYLIVIDDIWDAKPWETIKLALANKNCESRVITTTRSTAIASCLTFEGGNVYQMKCLSFEDSKRLLLKRAFGSENLSCTHLGSVPDEILRKCDGLPLAIITISSMLADKHAKCEWDRVLNDIGTALAKNPGAEKMTAILSMSYFDIPHHLRTCLLYLSVFPEDYHIEKQRLINRWIAEGFIHEEEGRTRYEIGERFFTDLINRSMIQPVNIKHGQATACRVHDIILDYIECKASEVNFVTLLDSIEHIYASEHKVRRLCVSNHSKEHVGLWASLILSQVRSLTIFGLSVKISLLPSTALRVLDLGDCRTMNDHHLASIEKLSHLMYLRLSSRTISKLPEKIGELRCLQTLDVRGTSIEELPLAITKLQRLAHLYVDYVVRFPEGMIEQMHSLEELMDYGVQSYQQEKSLQEFSKLSKLRTLEIKWDFDLHLPSGSEGLNQDDGFNNNVRTFLSSCNVYNLDIMDVSYNRYPLWLDSLHPAAPSLRKLSIQRCLIYKVPNWMASLGNLSVLELWIICLRPEDVEILGAIPSLLYLKLDSAGGTNGRITVHSSNGFRSLKYFFMRIFYCGTSLGFEVGSMPNLEHMKLVFRVHDTECLNGTSSLGIQHLSALSKLEVQIYGKCMRDSNYDPMEDKNDGAIRCVASGIHGAVRSHPNRPTVRFETAHDEYCEHFECYLKEWNQEVGGVLTEWLKIWQINELRTKQTDDTYEEEEVAGADEKGMEQHEGQW